MYRYELASVALVMSLLVPTFVSAEALGAPPGGQQQEQLGAPPSGQTSTGSSTPSTTGSTGTSTPSSSTPSSSSSSSCGEPPLKPCAGQGSSEATTGSSSPASTDSTQSSGSTTPKASPSSKSTESAVPAPLPEDASAVTKAIAAQTESAVSPLAALFTVDGQPRTLAIGSRTFRVLDLVGWTLLGLMVLATLLEVYFFVKQRRLWGIVYDARTKTPVELAVVRLFDQAKHKLLETRVTNPTGRYSFLADPGEYYLDATKEGFHFPSRIVTSATDNEYVNVYRGEVVKLKAGQSLVAVDIPVDSESGEVAKPSFYRRFVYPFLSAIRLPLLLVTLLTLIVYAVAILKPTPLIAFLGTILALLFIVEFIFVRRTRR